MLFTEGAFYLWLAASFVVFWSAPPRYRGSVLLILSLLFWAISSPAGLGWLAAAFCVTHVAASRAVVDSEKQTVRDRWITVAIGVLVGLLALAKFGPRMIPALDFWGGGEGAIGGLPFGISYFTFHCIGYLLDVKWSTQKPFKAARLGLYLGFFSKASMGPIARSGDFNSQTDRLRGLTWCGADFGPACAQIIVGLFAKFVLAERLKLFVDGYFGLDQAAAVPGLFLTIGFSWQLYYDFFGYSLIAVGIGRLFGYELPNNFNRPFFASSVSDFWKRWHISLSSWFQDYLYTPIRFGLRRHRTLSMVVAGMVTFVAIGIWHGTGWTFVILGFIHGITVTVEGLSAKRLSKYFPNWLRAAQILLTFLFVSTSLVFFRAPTVGDAVGILSDLFRFDATTVSHVFLLLSKFDILLVVSFGLLIEFFTRRGWVSGSASGFDWMRRLSSQGQAVICGFLVALVWFFGCFGKTSFLYTQF